ncbi:MAG: ComF family protein [Phycisphaerae bacterium]|nr:ComF family protein [Phycisphaerae bacterium]
MLIWNRPIRVGQNLGVLADLLFPPVCVICGTPGIDRPKLLCDPCGAELETLCDTAYCPTCARTVPPFVVTGGCCNHCRDEKRRISGVARIGPYRDQFRRLLHAFKYQRRWTLAAYLGQRIADEMRQNRWFGSIEALVTVPPWWFRRIRRGDYPPAMLARQVARHTGIPLIPALRRIKGGPSQVGLTAPQRAKNVRGKFAMTPGVRIEGATLCLIDDVMTTGATIEECARILLKAGAADVYAAVTAHVSRDAPSLIPPPQSAP